MQNPTSPRRGRPPSRAAAAPRPPTPAPPADLSPSAHPALRAAEVSVATHKAELKNLNRRLSEIREKIITEEQSFHADKRVVSDAAIASALAGEAEAPEVPDAVRRRIQAAPEKISALGQAATILESEIIGTKARLADAERELNTSRALIIADARDQYAQRFRAALESILEPATALLAIDQLQVELLGENFVVRSVEPGRFWRSGVAVQKLLTAIPGRLRPESIEFSSVKERAHERAKEFYREIQEG